MYEWICFNNKQDIAEYCWQERLGHDVTSVLCQEVRALSFLFSRVSDDRCSLCIPLQAIFKPVKKVTSVKHERMKLQLTDEPTVSMWLLPWSCYVTSPEKFCCWFRGSLQVWLPMILGGKLACFCLWDAAFLLRIRIPSEVLGFLLDRRDPDDWTLLKFTGICQHTRSICLHWVWLTDSVWWKMSLSVSPCVPDCLLD